MKKNVVIYYIKAFFTGIILLLIMSTISNCVPFGKYLYNNVDSFYMYPQLLVHSIRTLFDGNFFYNLNSFLGSDFYNVRTLYMNSPLNLLIIFFKNSNVFSFYTFLIYLRTGLSTLTMCVYLNSISKDKYKWKQILFGLFYTFSSFGIAYSVHIMWMDCFILLPLVILGLDRLIEKDKIGIYIICLTLSILVNFYIGFTVCIFSFLYFIYKCYVMNNFKLKVIKSFVISSLLCGLMSCIVLIPQVYSLMAGRGNTFSLEALKGINWFTLLTLPVNFVTGTFSSYDVLSDGGVLVYSTVLVLVMNILYYFNDNIDKRSKKGALIFTLFFIISFNLKFIDYTWNMFQKPVWFAHRYAFVFVFFFIVIAFKNLEKLSGVRIDTKKINIILIIFSLLIFLSFTFKAKTMEVSRHYIYSLYFSLILLIVYFLFFQKKYFKYLMLVFVLLELGFNGYNIFCENTSYTMDDVRDYTEAGNYIQDLKEIDNTFYRTVIPNTGANDSMLYNYYSTSMFSSSYNENTRYFLKEDVDYITDNINNMFSTYENPSLLSLFGIKYVVGNSEYYEKIDDNIFYNDKVLSIGFVVPGKIDNIGFEENNQYYNINQIYSLLLKENVNIFEDVKVDDYVVEGYLDEFDTEKYKITYSFVAASEGVIVPNRSDLFEYFVIKINDDVYDNRKDKVTIKYSDLLYYLEEGDKVEIEINVLKRRAEDFKNLSFDCFGVKILNEVKFQEAINKLQSYSCLENITTDDSVLSGSVKSNGGTLFISIPYLDTFKIYVDGEKVDYYKIFDTFIGIDIPEGEHNVVIKYIPKGFIFGMILSLIGLLITLVYFKLKKCNIKV